MPKFTPRRLVLLALFIGITIVFSYLHTHSSIPYLGKSSVSVLLTDDASWSGGHAPDSQGVAQNVDVHYLSNTFQIPEADLQSLIDAPTKDSVKSFLQNLGTQGHEFNILKTEKNQADDARQHDSGAAPLDGGNPSIPKMASNHQDYDPNLSRDFKWNSDFYINNGVKAVQYETQKGPESHMPYPDYNSPDWQQSWKGRHVPCYGARGKRLNESEDDQLKAYPALPVGFPMPSLGDSAMVRVSLNHCIDRYQRYGPYGFRHGRQERVEGWQRPSTMPDWASVAWDRLQDRCVADNQDRYLPDGRHTIDSKIGKSIPKSIPPIPQSEQGQGPKYRHRTAVLLRTTYDYRYTENDLLSIRAMITELSLLSGGEYQVFNLVHVTDPSIDMFENSQEYDKILRKIPQEIRSISILWNDKLLEEWYPKVGNWDGTFHTFMPLQWFIINRPEFDFVWNWDLDVRFTGNHYELLEGTAAYAKVIPRKNSWERNQRFFVPSLHESYSYDWFLVETDDIITRATNEKGHRSIWGPLPYDTTVQRPIGGQPPTSLEDDGFRWGSGDQADLITFQPIFDPIETSWDHKNNLWNFVPGVRPFIKEGDFTGAEGYHGFYRNIPRRASTGTTVRLSKRQLYAMHNENLEGRTMHSEMLPATVALHHGLKAVFAPIPMWADRVWTPTFLNGIFNADQGEDTAWNAKRGSAYDSERIHNFDGMSWSDHGGFARRLYRRWMGWTSGERDSVPGIGGDMWEQRGLRFRLSDHEGPTDAEGMTLVGGRGRMCLPPMLLHPVGDVYEAAEENPEPNRIYG